MDVVNLSFFVCSHFPVRQPREMKQTVAFCLRRGKFIKMKKVLPTSHIAIGARYFARDIFRIQQISPAHT